MFKDPPAHEPAANEPTPDPSQEGNCPSSSAPLLGGVGGGFQGRNARTKFAAFLGPLPTPASRGEEEKARFNKICAI